MCEYLREVVTEQGTEYSEWISEQSECLMSA